MFLINNKYLNKNRMLDKTDLMDISGFPLASPKKVFQVSGCQIRKINIVKDDLAVVVAYDIVMNNYNKLIDYLTNLLVDDSDDSGDSYREALNRIEKFRLMVKNKYRKYLSKKELQLMSKQLVLLKKELNKKLLTIHNSYINSISKGR